MYSNPFSIAAGLVLSWSLLDSGLSATTSATTTATATPSTSSATTTSTSVAGTFVFSVDLLEGESGYFIVDGHDGVQPALTMVR